MKSTSCHRVVVNALYVRAVRSLILLLLLAPLLVPGTAFSQSAFEETAPQKYRIIFTDKENNPFSLNSPAGFLSPAALERRLKQGISLTMDDLPVTPGYLDSIRNTGARILTVSKWFNAVTIQTEDTSVLRKISAFPFVSRPAQGSARIVFTPGQQAGSGIQFTRRTDDFNYGLSEWQSAVHHGDELHDRGYTGKGVTIAVIDAGFYHVDRLPAFEAMRNEGRILGTRDFVNRENDVYTGHTHGMIVLSIIGGYLPGELIGTAPDASFWLLRSEDTGSEYPVEEDNWVSAAEFADSVGADIINTSLGYSTFDDSTLNHSYADMDGNTARISRAADMAAARGMLVVVSAGNQGGTPWYYISAPADADSVLSVAAMDSEEMIATFSSHGPSSDGRVKPDVTAVGKGTWMADPVTGVRQGNGTSLSAPVITGLSACLWQAASNASAEKLRQVIRQSCDRYTSPDNDYGYGIPDFILAMYLARFNGDGDPPVVFPNPFNNLIYIVFQQAPDTEVRLTLTDLSGRVEVVREFPPFQGRRSLSLDDLPELTKGIYLLKVASAGSHHVVKLLKF